MWQHLSKSEALEFSSEPKPDQPTSLLESSLPLGSENEQQLLTSLLQQPAFAERAVKQDGVFAQLTAASCSNFALDNKSETEKAVANEHARWRCPQTVFCFRWRFEVVTTSCPMAYADIRKELKEY